MAVDLSDEALRRRARDIQRDANLGCSGLGIETTALRELQEVRDAARSQVAELEAREGRLLGNISDLQDTLDELAEAVAPVEVIGEHTNGNQSWKNALELITPAAEVQALRAELAATELKRKHVQESFEQRALVIAAQERVLEKLCRRIERLREGHEHIAGMNTDSGVIAAESLRVDEMVAKATRPGDQCLILDMKYSRDWLIWWQPNSCGYTFFLANAGRYSLEKARSIARGSNRDLRIVPVDSAYEQSRLVVYSDQRYQLKEEAPHAD